MKNTFTAFILAWITPLFILSCAGASQVGDTDKSSPLSVDAIIQSVTGNELVLETRIPKTRRTDESYMAELANQVAIKSFFIEGLEIDVSDVPAVVNEIGGDTVRVLAGKTAPFSPGSAVRLHIPKKNIVMTDFAVIRGTDATAGRVTMEELTSALIDTGYFNVLERAKLKAVINELELSKTLSASGLAEELPENLKSRLLLADLLMGGTLANMGSDWEINLRLINVKNGQTVSAISMRMPLTAEQLRDSGPMNETFKEDALDASWVLGPRDGKSREHTCSVSLDATIGPEEVGTSLRMDYDFTGAGKKARCMAFTRKKRDLSLYAGVEFYVKGAGTGVVNIQTSVPKEPLKMDAWQGTFRATDEWRKIRIPFTDFVIGRSWIKEAATARGFMPGDQIFRPSHVEQVAIIIYSGLNPAGAHGTLNVGKLGFYR
ncbi:MAG: CIA30 family protein [Desulfobacterales bacterium]|nr:CIA30 family protein [Desulfobacterales bacterium]